MAQTQITRWLCQKDGCMYRTQTSHLYAAWAIQIDGDWQTLQTVP